MPNPSSSGRSRRPLYRSSRDPHANIRRNQRIRVPQVRVIGPDGSQIGVLPTEKALALAVEAGLDLVEVAAQATPPVCRIMDFGKYIYEQQKKSKDSKGGSSKIKEVKFRVRIEQHDYETKLRHAEEFLDKGNKVKLSLSFRGREMAHTDLGFVTINRAIADLQHIATADAEARLSGRSITVMLSPLPANRRKLKFNLPEEAGAPEGEDD
ncbi:MAG: translation initiation factor IF-3 [Puniceicoccaceae bacterium]|nr:MAG: translation initiation factor IF-3 [Puniceicoccaceae bacterium]